VIVKEAEMQGEPYRGKVNVEITYCVI